MIEFRNDLILWLLDEIAFLSVRIAGLKALGMNDEIFREIERLEQASGQLDPPDKARVEGPLKELKEQMAFHESSMEL